MSAGPVHQHEPLLIESSDDGPDRVHVRLVGELDLATVELVEESLLETLRSANGLVVLELHELAFCDSTGTSMILRLQKAADRRPVRLVLRNPTAAVRRVFELMALDEVMVIEGS